MATLTPLSTILSRMDRYTQLSVVDNTFKVRDLDEALRTIRRLVQFPWCLQKGSLRVFSNIKEYPVATDHDELAYLDVHDNPDASFVQRARYRYTSLRQFYEDPTNRNEVAEIWDGGSRFLGVNFKGAQQRSTTLDNGETASLWTASGDAASPTLDNVVFDQGNGSIRFTVTSSSGTAGMSSTLNSAVTNSNYKRNYYFVRVYLAAVPTSIALRFGADSSNYLSASVTAQFSGQAFKAGGWNWLAFDLNTATATGTITTSTSFNYQAVIMTGAALGSYFIDSSYLKEWTLQDYWYYSKYNVALVSSTVANQEYFYNSADTYAADSQLVADSEWVDVIMYDAMLMALTDEKDVTTRAEIKERKQEAWTALILKYPTLEPVITTNQWIFRDDFINPSLNNAVQV